MPACKLSIIHIIIICQYCYTYAHWSKTMVASFIFVADHKHINQVLLALMYSHNQTIPYIFIQYMNVLLISTGAIERSHRPHSPTFYFQLLLFEREAHGTLVGLLNTKSRVMKLNATTT